MVTDDQVRNGIISLILVVAVGLCRHWGIAEIVLSVCLYIFTMANIEAIVGNK